MGSDARVLSDAQIETLRGALAHERSTPRMFLAGLVRSLLAAYDAAHTRAGKAERERDEWRARWNLENVARQDAVLARQQAERERDDMDNEFQSLAGRVAEYDALLTAALQAREQAEFRLGVVRDDYVRIQDATTGRAEQAEAALATERQSYGALIGIFRDWRTSHGHYSGINRCSACSTFRGAVDAELAKERPPSSQAAPHEMSVRQTLPGSALTQEQARAVDLYASSPAPHEPPQEGEG